MGGLSIDDIGEILSGTRDPVGDGSNTYRLVQLNSYDQTLADALSQFDPELSLEKWLEFTFGQSEVNRLRENDLYKAILQLQRGSGCGWVTGDTNSAISIKANTETTIYVPAKTGLKSGVKGPAILGSIQNSRYPEPLIICRGRSTFYSTRHQREVPYAVSTVDIGIKAGDILLAHHPGDISIAFQTCSWPTHAGIALSEKWVVDANKSDGKELRPDNRAVKKIPLMKIGAQSFFVHDSGNIFTPNPDRVRPEGGLVYRYIGDGKASEVDLENIRCKASEWASQQTTKSYRFALKSSQIRDTSKRGKPILEKRFDADGKAIGKDDKRLTYRDSKGNVNPTECQNIYCAELVWRAYRHAGVNLVDPKEMDLLATQHGIATAIIDNLSELTTFQSVAIMALKLRSNAAARKDIKTFMRMQAYNKLYFCAPWQLAGSPLTTRVAQFQACEAKYEKIKHADFRTVDYHPYDLIMAVLAEVKPGEKDDAKAMLLKKKETEFREERESLYNNPVQGLAEVKRLFDQKTVALVRDKTQEPVDQQQINDAYKQEILDQRIAKVDTWLATKVYDPNDWDPESQKKVDQDNANLMKENLKNIEVDPADMSTEDAIRIEDAIIKQRTDKIREERKKEFAELAKDNDKKRALFNLETDLLAEEIKREPVISEDITNFPLHLERYMEKMHIGKMTVTVDQPWDGAKEEKAPRLRFGLDPGDPIPCYNSQMDFHGNKPPFTDASNFDKVKPSETIEVQGKVLYLDEIAGIDEEISPEEFKRLTQL